MFLWMESHNLTIGTKPLRAFQHSFHSICFFKCFAKSDFSSAIGEFTQQEGRKRRTAKHLCVTNVTGLLLACFGLLQKDLLKGR